MVDLEHALENSDRDDAREHAAAFGVDEALLTAAIATRAELGRLNDLPAAGSGDEAGSCLRGDLPRGVLPDE